MLAESVVLVVIISCTSLPCCVNNNSFLGMGMLLCYIHKRWLNTKYLVVSCLPNTAVLK